MTAKKFFKSAAFKSVAALLIIVIAAGAILAVCNDLLFVSPLERRNRMFAKIYGGDVTEQETLLSDEAPDVVYPDGTARQAYLMSDGSYIVQSTGTGGYSGGTITVWVIFECDGAEDDGLTLTGIARVVYESNVKQSYISRFTEADYAQFTVHDGKIAEGLFFGDDIEVVKTGASAPFTFAALTNAVNVALRYLREEVIGTVERTAYRYEEYVNLNDVTAEVNAGEKEISYRIKTKGNSPAKAFEISVTVTNGAITDYKIVTNGSTNETYASYMPEEMKDGSYFIGKNKAQIEALLTGEGALAEGVYGPNPPKQSATRSVESCVRAAAFAVCNFERILAEGGIA